MKPGLTGAAAMGFMLVLGAVGAMPAAAQTNTFPVDGNVGIGTTTPVTSLSIKGPDPGAQSNKLGFRIENTPGFSVGMFVSANRGVFGSTNLTPLDFISNGILPKMTLDTSGYLGIGTTTPISKLHIIGTDPGTGSATLGIRVENGNGYNASMMVANNRAIIGTTNSTPIDFISNGLVPRMTLLPTGALGIGTSAPTALLHVAGAAQVDGNMAVSGNIAAKYQDVAEWVKAPSQLPAGTVLIIDPAKIDQVLEGSKAYDTRVAGVVSEQPGVILGEGGDDKVKVAHSGRVKVKVDAGFGAIATGDLLVMSSTPGHAMRSTPVELNGITMHRPGTLIGKALEPLSSGQGEILVLLMLQ
jgi:hypothetical protein